MTVPAPTDAWVYLQSGDDKLTVMRELMESSKFSACLLRHLKESSKQKEDFSIAIKIFIDDVAADRQTDLSTDPELVDSLIAEIQGLGFIHITVVVDRQQGADRYLSGLKKTGYAVRALSEEAQLYDFGSFLGRQPIAAAWLNADVRISFGKNRTSPLTFYEGCISNVQFSTADSAAPQRIHANGLRPRRYEYAVLLADRLPVQFGFLDAWLSADGPKGGRPNATRTLLAAENLLALDWVAGEKMNLDPALNPVVQEAMYRWGVFHLIRQGNTTPWPGWKNVSSGPVIWNHLFSNNL
jgi:uncharacterized protein (DUF362 family)